MIIAEGDIKLQPGCTKAQEARDAFETEYTQEGADAHVCVRERVCVCVESPPGGRVDWG